MRTEFDPRSPDVNAYALMTALVVPRPIAWVSSMAADGTGNLAPHSFFTVVCADPPIVAFSSIGRKDTLRNVLQTREFTISLATRTLLPQVNASSAQFAGDQDEATALGIDMRPSKRVTPPSVAASPASLECSLHSTVDLDSAVLVLGRVEWISVADEVIVNGSPNYDLLDTVSRLGGNEWGLRGPVHDVTRPRTPADIDPNEPVPHLAD